MRPQHCLLSLLIGFMIASTENGLLAQQDDEGATTPTQVPDFPATPPQNAAPERVAATFRRVA